MQASMLPSLLTAQQSNHLAEKAKTCVLVFFIAIFHRSGRSLNVPKNNFLFAEAIIRTVPNDRIGREHGIVCPYKHR